MKRLEKSVRLLVSLNKARRLAARRLSGARRFAKLLEAQLEQNDHEARARQDARQLSIYDALSTTLH